MLAMSTYALRFVGQERLSNRLSDFDLNQFFQLTESDIKAVGAQFRSDHRASAALMMLCLRATGRPLDSSTVLPRNLLRYVGETFRTAAPTIASLRSIYQRSQTLYKHQLWAKTHLGLKDLDDTSETELVALLKLKAAEASHPDDLATAACHWLYERRILIPGPRRVQQWARDAFAATEAEILQAITKAVPPATLKRCRESVYGQRPDGGATQLEWLKTPSRHHGPTSLAEVLEKIAYLKSLTVHQWSLDGIAIPKQRAYAQQVQARRPAKSKEIKDTTQTIELVCFLRMSLLELTDLAMQQSSRRSQKLFRDAAEKAQSSRGRSESAGHQQALKAREVLRDKSKTWRTRCLEADELLSELLDAPQGSFLSHVRRNLSADHQRVKAFLGGLEGLEFGGQPDDAGFAQWSAWRELQGARATEIPPDFKVPEVGAAWHALVHEADPKSGLQAFAACTMMSMRKSLRSGKLWIDHSLSYRQRDQMLIAPEEWESERDKYIALLGLPRTADEFFEPALDTLRVGVTAVSEACQKGKIEIGADGMLHLPAVTALPDDGEPRRMRDLIYQLIGDVQFSDILLETDALCSISEVLLGHRAETVVELLALYAAMLAHGTDIDAKTAAFMIPGIDTAQVSVAMRALETHGRLRRANERVVEFQGRVPLPPIGEAARKPRPT